jgi:hypothetical protein
MQVIRRDRGGVDGKAMLHPHPAKRCARQIDIFGQQREPAMGQISRKEATAAEEQTTPIMPSLRLARRDPMGFAALDPSYFFDYLIFKPRQASRRAAPIRRGDRNVPGLSAARHVRTRNNSGQGY